MSKELNAYVESLLEDVPHFVYEVFFILFCISVFLFILWKRKTAYLYIVQLILAEYVSFIYCTTVFFRSVISERKLYFTPFWSYSRQDLIAENIMNVVVFIPVGILFFVTQIVRRSQLKAWSLSIISGLSLSVGVESLQFIFKKGYAEVDDLMHNTLGCFIGCTLCLIIAKSWSYSTNWCRLHWGKESR